MNFSKLSIAGFISILLGLIILGFQSLQAVTGTGTEIEWKNLSLATLLKPEHVNLIQSISWNFVQDAATYLINLPLFIFLIALGVILLILNSIFGRMT